MSSMMLSSSPDQATTTTTTTAEPPIARAETAPSIKLCGRGSYGTCLVSSDKSMVWKLIRMFNLSATHPDQNGFEATTTREITLVNFNLLLGHTCIIRCLETMIEADSLQRAQSEPESQTTELSALLRHELLAPPESVQVRLTLDYGGVQLWDWIRGGELVKQDPYVPWIIYQVLHVLATLERFQIVHNDLKPWNIVINPDTCDVRVIDWGSAVFDSQRIQFHQVCKTLLCTLAYAAPEMHPQAGGKGPRGPLHPWNDVFSLGMTLLAFIHQHWPNDMEVVRFIRKYPAAVHLDVWRMRSCAEYESREESTSRCCSRPAAVQAAAPQFWRAVPLIERMLTLNPEHRPLASELLKDAYFDACRSRLVPVDDLVRRVMEPAQTVLPPVTSLFARHPQLNVRVRAVLIRTLRGHAQWLKMETSLTLGVSLLDRCLTQPECLPISIEQYKVLSFAALFVASDIRFNNVPWLDWYRSTQESLQRYPPRVLSNAVRWLMESLNYDLWTLTFDSLSLDQDHIDYEVVQTVMEQFPLVERTQLQLNAKYRELCRGKNKRSAVADDEISSKKGKVS